MKPYIITYKYWNTDLCKWRCREVWIEDTSKQEAINQLIDLGIPEDDILEVENTSREPVEEDRDYEQICSNI